MRPNLSPCHHTLPGQSCLLRDAKGRPQLPKASMLVPGAAGVQWTDEELNEIYRETLRLRRIWRFWHYLRLSLYTGFLFWTFILMPLAARHRWPFQ